MKKNINQQDLDMQESSQSQLFDELKNIPKEHLKNLESIFSFVKLDKKSSSERQYFSYRFLFNDGNTIPDPDKNKDKKPDYPSSENTKIKKDDTLPSMLWKLEQYYSFTPAPDESTISYYDYVRIKTAKKIAEELYKENPKTGDSNPYALIKVNFSGIQKFIYTISSKGALKSLRGRSFFLELLTEHIAIEILGKLKLTKVNVVYSGGGNLYIIAPNINDLQDSIENAIKNINDDIYFKSAYKIKIYHGIEPFGDNDDGNVWSAVEKQISEKKHKPNISDDFFEPKAITGETCQICHHEEVSEKEIGPLSPDNPEIKSCPFCRSIFQLGKDLINENKYLYRTTKDSENSVKIGGYSYHLSNKSQEDFDYAWIINPGYGDDDLFRHENMSHIHLANYSDKQDFGELASASIGNDLLGVLRMDVDNLGQIFQKGLKELTAEQKNFEYMASLSRFTGIFFKRYLNSICEGKTEQHRLLAGQNEKKRNVSIVYAGGDDLFIVGAWNDMAELAFDIQEEFRKFTGANPSITISGGLTLHKPKYPLYRMAEMAGEAEEKAKNNEKDSICLFYNPDNNGKHAYKWDEAEKQIIENTKRFLTFGNKLNKNNVLESDFDTGFIYRILTLSKKSVEPDGIFSLPSMAYTLARFIARNKKYVGDPKWEEFKIHLMKVDTMKNLRCSLIWLMYLTRDKGN